MSVHLSPRSDESDNPSILREKLQGTATLFQFRSEGEHTSGAWSHYQQECRASNDPHENWLDDGPSPDASAGTSSKCRESRWHLADRPRHHESTCLARSQLWVGLESGDTPCHHTFQQNWRGHAAVTVGALQPPITRGHRVLSLPHTKTFVNHAHVSARLPHAHPWSSGAQQTSLSSSSHRPSQPRLVHPPCDRSNTLLLDVTHDGIMGR